MASRRDDNILIVRLPRFN